INQFWNPVTNSWTNVNLKSYIYDNEQLQAVATSYWDEDSNDWQVESRCVFSYQKTAPVSSPTILRSLPSSRPSLPLTQPTSMLNNQ
ncbi:MAG TPA: hypothetical protein PKH93_08600, partial [Chitinophagales bacterium]|nr:hypothetical protein [Chitinophagales bacterium]